MTVKSRPLRTRTLTSWTGVGKSTVSVGDRPAHSATLSAGAHVPYTIVVSFGWGNVPCSSVPPATVTPPTVTGPGVPGIGDAGPDDSKSIVTAVAAPPPAPRAQHAAAPP